MTKRRTIIDTNVLYAGLYSAKGASYRILRAIERDTIRPVLSTSLLLEYEDVLRRKRASLGLSDREIDEVLDGFCKRSDHQKIYFLWRPHLPDPKDAHILELAVASGVEDFVTHNVKDFRAAKTFGVKALTPKQLLEEMR